MRDQGMVHCNMNPFEIAYMAEWACRLSYRIYRMDGYSQDTAIQLAIAELRAALDDLRYDFDDYEQVVAGIAAKLRTIAPPLAEPRPDEQRDSDQEPPEDKTYEDGGPEEEQDESDYPDDEPDSVDDSPALRERNPRSGC